MTPLCTLPLALALALAAIAPAASAQEAQIAVAANFTAAAQDLAAAFRAETGHDLGLSFGATGQLYTQITQGAPFAAFLAADPERPARVVEEGLADPESVFTYAIGRLALIGAEDGTALDAEALAGEFAHLAIAEPAAAPYGAAALETIAALGLTETLAERLVIGHTIAQTYQFVTTGNAEFGFVALSQIMADPARPYWLVPQDLHAPIRQDAVLIAGAEGVDVARAFLDFLGSEPGRAIIEGYGYSTP